MSVCTTPPSWPVIDHAPGFLTTLSNLRMSDIATIAAFSGISYPLGYYFGRPIRTPTARAAATIGFVAGVLFASQNAGWRLMGQKENDREVKKFKFRQDTWGKNQVELSYENLEGVVVPQQKD